jgi:hypothetical protein
MMTWSIASQEVLPSGPTNDGKSRNFRKRQLTKGMVDSFELVGVDAMKLVHMYFSSVQLLAFISKSAAVIAIVNSILSHCHEFFKACPKLVSIFLIFDGPVSKLKQAEISSRYGDVIAKKDKSKQLLSRLAKIDRDSDSFESHQKEFVDAAHEARNATFVSDIIAFIHALLLIRLQDPTNKNIHCYFASHVFAVE